MLQLLHWALTNVMRHLTTFEATPLGFLIPWWLNFRYRTIKTRLQTETEFTTICRIRPVRSNKKALNVHCTHYNVLWRERQQGMSIPVTEWLLPLSYGREIEGNVSNTRELNMDIHRDMTIKSGNVYGEKYYRSWKFRNTSTPLDRNNVYRSCLIWTVWFYQSYFRSFHQYWWGVWYSPSPIRRLGWSGTGFVVTLLILSMEQAQEKTSLHSFGSNIEHLIHKMRSWGMECCFGSNVCRNNLLCTWYNIDCSIKISSCQNDLDMQVKVWGVWGFLLHWSWYL